MAGVTTVIWWYGISLTHITDFVSDGVVATLIICISTPAQVLLLALMARQAGSSATDYLGLTLPDRRDVVSGIISVIVFMVLADGMSWLLGRDIVTQFQLDLYRTASGAGWLPWLLLTVRGGANRRRNSLSRLSVSRLAPLYPRCMARDRPDRSALGRRPSAI
jgi:hypothetical protein